MGEKKENRSTAMKPGIRHREFAELLAAQTVLYRGREESENKGVSHISGNRSPE